MSLSDSALSAIMVAERTTSILSLVTTTFVIGTFLCSRSFRKPITRLVFYASWGNVMTNAATLVSRSGVLAGQYSALCLFQGFFIQWFMPADALWTFAMACNVYLTFFRKYDASRLRSIEWKYAIMCYGVPFIPSFVYFFIKSDSKGPIYGSAVLWCWVSTPWDVLRIAVFYGPTWFIILLTFTIYIRVGLHIYRNRRLLHNFSSADQQGTIDSAFEIHASKVVRITSEAAHANGPKDTTAQAHGHGHGDLESERISGAAENYVRYSVTVERGDGIPMAPIKQPVPPASAAGQNARNALTSAAAWAYCKYAILYFIALLVTWVPSTINRVYSLARPNSVSFGLELASAIVLPLQGFWNSIIYIAISWSLITKFLRRDRGRRSYAAGRRPLNFRQMNRKHLKQSSGLASVGSSEESENFEMPSPAPDDRPSQQAANDNTPSAPVAVTPGPRASRFQDIYHKALRATVKANSYENFATCFPTPARYVPASLESVHRQLNAKLEEGATAEFNEILKEREVVKGLNELDRLVGDARRRKDGGESESSVPPHMLGADGLYQAHLAPFLEHAQDSLNAKLETTQSQNAELADRIIAQRKEMESLLSGLEAVMADLEGSAKASTQYSKEHSLRQKSMQVDEDIKKRTAV
ncbi:uncharacterized protein TRUGW13939_00080 [Talaromyces rugulosus]|uniref:G-protein coupled receptors family 2 profile 2 domain-containing protein n=1 Tax=Talaromyces rugulosus TaxID=121627 RepID=A0A7H8QGJ4_TALRU|nr:uncharacterized protein TRUGW13939_00080 [Talaromyces rugulosus]QKX53009.1 hypothetical protein TRUGW13939_00080 [Talaromyces rugulosus]